VLADPVFCFNQHKRNCKNTRRKNCRACQEALPIEAFGNNQYLDLRRPIYQKTAAYGHFGRSDPDLMGKDKQGSRTRRDAGL